MQSSAVQVIRSIGSVSAGYLILALTNMAYVVMWYVNPVADWSPTIIIAASVPFTFVCSLIGGYACGWVAGRSEMLHAVVLAGIMTAITIANIVLAVAVEPTEYKIVYLVTMVAGTLFGASRSARKAKAARS